MLRSREGPDNGAASHRSADCNSECTARAHDLVHTRKDGRKSFSRSAGLGPSADTLCACLQPHGTKLEAARADAPFAWDGCARHRRSACDRPTMLPCMSCSCSTSHMLMTVCSAALLRDAKRGAGDISCATACTQRLWNVFPRRPGHACQRACDAALRERSESARQLDLSMVRIAHR